MIKIRPILRLTEDKGLKVMSYNVLAQALVRRDQYPTNGKFIRWSSRSPGFVKEIETYNPDLIFLQEVDNDQHKFWRELLQRNGFDCQFAAHRSKKQGLGVAWKSALFSAGRWETLDYDATVIDKVPRQCDTANIAFILELLPKIPEYPPLLTANTHLYWHPNGSYERARQVACLLTSLASFNVNDCAVIAGGDFNTEPFDPSYLLACGHPLHDRAQGILEESVSTDKFERAKPVFIPGIMKEPPKEEPKKDPSEPPKNPNQLSDAPAALRGVKEYFSSLKYVCTSLYARDYSKVHEANVDPTGEPKFTNWTDDFRSTLDYIMVINDRTTEPKYPTTTSALLRLPETTEMGPEPSSIPRRDYYPSDHLALMAEVVFKMK